MKKPQNVTIDVYEGGCLEMNPTGPFGDAHGHDLYRVTMHCDGATKQIIAALRRLATSLESAMVHSTIDAALPWVEAEERERANPELPF